MYAHDAALNILTDAATVMSGVVDDVVTYNTTLITVKGVLCFPSVLLFRPP